MICYSYLFLTKKWKVEQNFQRLGVPRENDEFSNTPVESFRSYELVWGVKSATVWDQNYHVYLR